MELTNLKVSFKNKFIASLKLDKSDFTSMSIFIEKKSYNISWILNSVRLLRIMAFKKLKISLNYKFMFNILRTCN